ncbi:MAG: hypothetical protein M3467_00265 [Actinomycetota bacterium]|nr:hypothetical protein [Actinomycetota bacterium]
MTSDGFGGHQDTQQGARALGDIRGVHDEYLPGLQPAGGADEIGTQVFDRSWAALGRQVQAATGIRREVVVMDRHGRSPRPGSAEGASASTADGLSGTQS